MSGGKTPTIGIDVELGEHAYRVQPQRHAYLKRELRSFVDDLSELGETSVDNLLDVGTDQFYALLAVMIPDLMPKWEWDGYPLRRTRPSRDDYERDTDRSPTPPEIKGALQAAINVNEFDWVGQLKNFIGPDLIRAQIRAALAARAAQTLKNKTTTPSSDPSPSSPHQNGESDPTSSGLSVPTDPIAPTSG